MLKYAFAGLAAVLMSGAIHIYAQGPSRNRVERHGTRHFSHVVGGRPSREGGRLSVPSQTRRHPGSKGRDCGLLWAASYAFLFQLVLERRTPGTARGAALPR